MVAMVVIATSILFLTSMITQLLMSERKSREELEIAALLYEMAYFDEVNQDKHDLVEKAQAQHVVITEWTKNSLSVEGETSSLELVKK